MEENYSIVFLGEDWIFILLQDQYIKDINIDGIFYGIIYMDTKQNILIVITYHPHYIFI